ncbi:MAG: DUF4166 domain-containing protein [Pseudomonadota bacterium]
MTKTVLVLGGYGVFGGHLAKALSANPEFSVIVAGRRGSAADAFCKETLGDGSPCTPMQLDRNDIDLEAKIASTAPFIVVDAAGPFQSYTDNPYRVALAAIRCGAHYLDLSDDAEFTGGIDNLHEAASNAQVTVLSGVSSVPALSSTAVGALCTQLDDIHLIESAIISGNQAPRGRSVIRAILAQVGRPLTVWRARAPTIVRGWGGLTKVTVKDHHGGVKCRRWASYIGAPDLSLFPAYFQARSVLFRAGLGLTLLHGGLWLMSWLVRLNLMHSLSPLAGLLKRGAGLFEGFGSDHGGMVVSVAGTTQRGDAELRAWHLYVDDGDGPYIPTIPVQIMSRKLADGIVTPGARACLEEFSLAEAENTLGHLSVQTYQEAGPFPLAFEQVLGGDFRNLPQGIRDLHTIIDVQRWKGRAHVKRGQGLMSRLTGWIVGFPPSADDIDVGVEMTRTPQGECWTRKFEGGFGTKRFRSQISAKKKGSSYQLLERFGVLEFTIGLTRQGERLSFPVVAGTVLGIPIPSAFLPKSDTYEYMDAQNRACFHVNICLPFFGARAGHVATYSGWLQPAD